MSFVQASSWFLNSCCCSAAQCVWLFATPWTGACQASLFLTTSWVCSNSCPLSWWCHPIISSSVTHFSSCPQPFPTSGSFQMSQFSSSGGQSIRVSASASVLPMTIQVWFSLELTGLISLLSKGLSRIFSTRQEHWSGLPFPSPMYESEKWKWSCSVFDLATPCTAAYQAPLSMGFSRQEYWSGVPTSYIYN